MATHTTEIAPILNLAGEEMGVGGSEQDDLFFDGRRRRLLFQWVDGWIDDDQPRMSQWIRVGWEVQGSQHVWLFLINCW
ncbi:MAG: hypothetical protein GY696_09535 [Gammaproteobacteria bacterium]|nr:hypothetical protein [Gammaproteobacteria bacterium]